MEYRLLGPIEAHSDGEPVDIGTYKQRALLAILLINANQVVSTDRIIEELWGDDPGRDRQNTLWVNVSGLRAALEPDREKRTEGTILLTRSPGYVISVDPADLDATRFEQLALEGRALLDADPGAASLVLSEALALWRGHAFEEFTYESFAQPEIARLEELRLITVEDRVDADLSVGRSRELVGELESLVRQHPLRERLTGHLMVALHRSGRQGEALRAFGALQTRLGEELGLEPSAEITKLEERIVLDDPTLRQAKAALVAGGRPEPGLSVRGYELREKIGEGALGYVYRAYQPAVGREVAIKVIRPELANNPDFIRRFEAEAQLVARLEHPQIVPLFDYWREPDSAFLVMRIFERGSLQDALDAGPLSTEGAARVIEQLGAALSTAHHRGVTHGDIKPANVMIDGDGNAYLADFGMSLDYGAAGGSPSSLVAPYASPEQRASGEVTSLSDLYSLGVVADHALRGATGEGKRPDSPLVGPAADVIARATAERPGDRFPDVESFVEELGVALGGTALVETTALLDAENPYRGLRAFEEGDASRFFGRERLIERLVARLGHPGPQGRMVALVGPSGAGKSSVVRAGLIPALRQGALPGSDRWFILTMTPGSHPCEALEDALLKVAVDPPSGLLEELMSNGIPAVVQSLLPEAGSQLLLIVDQLEELFTHASPQDARTFLTAVADAASDRHSSVKVVTTLRADFYDHPLRHEAFGELVRLGTEVITPMTAEELERAVAAPAAEVGVSYETGLVAQIVSDMAGQSAALPLMQYSLTELFEQRTGATISTESYRALGGISATLVRRADSLYEALDADAKTSTREVFLRLVTLGEGSEDTRRRALQSELTDGGGDGAVSVLDTFGRHRLLSFDRDPVTRAPTVEIAHEALLTEWSRLSQWIEDARTDVLAQRRLAAAAADWRERHNNPDYLLTGARYIRYGGWLENPPVRLTEGEGQFLAASREAAATEVQTERRRVRRLRRLVVGVGVAFVLALVAGVVAGVQRNTAEQQTRLAVGRELAGSALAAIDDDPQLSILLALEAAATTEPDGVILREAVEAMHAAVLASRIEWVADLGSAGSSIGARFSPDGSRIAAGSADGPIRIFDATTGVVMATLIGHEGQVPDVRWMTDGNLVSIGHSFLGDGTVRVWNGDSGELLETWTGVDPTNLDVSPDGSLVATSAPFTGEIKVLNRGTGEVRTIATVPFPVGIAFDPVDGSRLAVGSFEFAEKGGGLIVLDPLSGEELLRVPVAGGACDAAWSPDGALIGVAGEGDSVLDAATGAEVAAFNGHHSNSCSINFSVDGELVVTGGDDAAPRVWEATTGREVLPLPGHTERVGFVSFSPDGSRVLSTSPDGTLRVWDVRPEGRRESIAVHDPSITADAIYLDGTDLFLSGSRSGAAGVWSRIDGTLRREYEGNSRLFAVTASPAADLAVTGSLDGTIALWSITTGENVRRIQLGVPINGLAMSADGRLLGYTAGDLFAGESVAYLVNPATGEEIPLQGAGEFAAWLVSISPDGTRFAAGNGSLIKLWDLASGESVRTIDTGNQSIWAGILSLTFDDSGERIIVTTQAGPVAIFDSASGELLQTFIGHAGVVVDAALTPDGTLLASVGGDGTIRLWDVQTGEETLRIQEPKLLTSVDFSEDGSQLLVAGEFGARVYEVETDNLFDLARSRLLRWWTTDECFQYLGTSECPEPASG